MKKLSVRILQDDSGFLTFEWIMLITVLVIGITGGLTAVRDALNWELGGTAGAIVSLDLSYLIKGPVKIKWSVDGHPGGYDDDDNAILYLSGIAAGSHYHYEVPKIAYRPRGDASIGGGDGLLQPGPPIAGMPGSVPHQGVHDVQDSTLEQGTYGP